MKIINELNDKMNKKQTAVIVEDVLAARDNLKFILGENHPEIEIIGEAESVVQAAKLLNSVQPEILFLDVELGDGTAFDLLDIIGLPNAQIIFTTASEEYAIRAFRYAALDYLMKPIDPDDLGNALSKTSGARKVQGDQIEILTDQLSNSEKSSRIALHTMEKVHVVDLADIMRCESDGNYTHFILKDQRPILVTRTLKEYDKLLKSRSFLRVHQSHLLNMEHIKEFVKTDGGYIVLSNGEKIPVSTRKRSAVNEALDSLNA